MNVECVQKANAGHSTIVCENKTGISVSIFHVINHVNRLFLFASSLFLEQQPYKQAFIEVWRTAYTYYVEKGQQNKRWTKMDNREWVMMSLPFILITQLNA